MGLFGFAPTLAGCLARLPRVLRSMFGAFAPVQGCFPPTSACSFHPSACFARSLGLAAPRFLSVGFHRRLFSPSLLVSFLLTCRLPLSSRLTDPNFLSVGFPTVK